MVDVQFQDDGRVRIFHFQNGEAISVTTDANKLRDMLPAALFMEVHDRCRALADIMSASMPSRLRQIN